MPLFELTSGDFSTLLGATIGAASALIGVALTGAVTYLSAKRTAEQQNHQKDKELRLQKLEELYLLCIKFEAETDERYKSQVECHHQLITYSEAKAAGISSLGHSHDIERRRMLVSVYFPNLTDANHKLSMTYYQFMLTLMDPIDPAFDASKFVQAHSEFSDACYSMKISVSSLGARILS